MTDRLFDKIEKIVLSAVLILCTILLAILVVFVGILVYKFAALCFGF